mmetsp:Transcript_6622/g.10869  ORF Transcript_6622/g.10869 Transcript_6622/m.10869 type:complete len:216 (+) Transcript_6622:177-824(+)
MTIRSSNARGHIVAHHLRTNHGHRFTLSRVHFTRHNRRTWLVFRQQNLAQSTARTTGQHPDIVRDLHQRSGQHIQSTRYFHHGIMSRQCLKFIVCASKRQSCKLGNFFRHFDIETIPGIQASADRRTSNGQIIHTGQGALHSANAILNLRGIATELLSQRQRRGIHQVRTANFDHVLKLIGFLVESVINERQRRQQRVVQLKSHCDVHGGRKRVV